MAKQQRRELQDWGDFKKQILASQTVDRTETEAVKQARKKELEADPEQWLKYYMPKYYTRPFRRFQLKFINRICKMKKKLFIGRAFARDHGKTTIWQGCALYMHLSGRWKNTLIISRTLDSASDFLLVIKKNLETNERIINDYGQQIGPTWTTDKIVLSNGNSFRAIGMGQNPRGTKNDEARPDSLMMDDGDDDEVCRSPERLETTWEWLIQSLLPCFDISGTMFFGFVNNLIAEDCLLARFRDQMADDFDVVNILDKDGKSTFHDQEDAEYMIQKMGGIDSIDCQKEYFNNPIVKGTVFKKEVLLDKDMLALHKYPALVAYLDPSFSDGAKSDHKSLVLVGRIGQEYHIIKVFCSVASIDDMIEWHYVLYRWLLSQNGLANWFIESVFFQKILLKDFAAVAVNKGFGLPIQEDTRQKPNKDARIVALQGYFNRGEVFFNRAESDNPHMKTLKTQFLGYKPGSTRTKKDGPDSFEGAKYKLDELFNMGANRTTHGAPLKNPKRF